MRCGDSHARLPWGAAALAVMLLLTSCYQTDGGSPGAGVPGGRTNGHSALSTSTEAGETTSSTITTTAEKTTRTAKPARPTDKKTTQSTPPATVTIPTSTPSTTADRQPAAADIFDGFGVIRLGNPRYIEVPGLYAAPGHEYCGGLYLDTRDDSYYCLTHMLQASPAVARVMEEGQFYFWKGDPDAGVCAFEIAQGKGSRQTYLYNRSKDLLLPIRPTAIDMEGLALSPDGRFALVSAPTDASLEQCNVYLLSTSDPAAAPVNLSQRLGTGSPGYNPVSVSPGGRFFVFPAFEGDEGWREPSWGLYDIQTGTLAKITGTIVRFLDGESRVAVETEGGGRVFDTGTGRDLTAETKLAKWQRCRVEPQYVCGADVSQVTLRLKDVFSGEESELKGGVSAFAEVDGLLYTYMHSESRVECTSLRDGKTTYIPINYGFAARAMKEAYSWQVNYHLDLCSNRTAILLSYHTARKEQDVLNDSR